MSEALMFETRTHAVFICGGCGAETEPYATTSQERAARWATEDGWLIDEHEPDADRCPVCAQMGEPT